MIGAALLFLLEPRAYLKDVLTWLPTTLPDQLADLLPNRWEAAHLAKLATASATAATSPTAPYGESGS